MQVSFNKQVGSEQLQYAGKTDHMWRSGGIFTPDLTAGGNAIDEFLISIMDQQLQVYNNKLNELEQELLEQIA